MWTRRRTTIRTNMPIHKACEKYICIPDQERGDPGGFRELITELIKAYGVCTCFFKSRLNGQFYIRSSLATIILLS